jgi:hypothetical protein
MPRFTSDLTGESPYKRLRNDCDHARSSYIGVTRIKNPCESDDPIRSAPRRRCSNHGDRVRAHQEFGDLRPHPDRARAAIWKPGSLTPLAASCCGTRCVGVQPGPSTGHQAGRMSIARVLPVDRIRGRRVFAGPVRPPRRFDLRVGGVAGAADASFQPEIVAAAYRHGGDFTNCSTRVRQRGPYGTAASLAARGRGRCRHRLRTTQSGAHPCR